MCSYNEWFHLKCSEDEDHTITNCVMINQQYRIVLPVMWKFRTKTILNEDNFDDERELVSILQSQIKDFGDQKTRNENVKLKN